VGAVAGQGQFRAVERHEVRTYAWVTAVRIDENLYFANANNVESKLQRLVRDTPEVKHVLILCGAVNSVDTTGVQMLLRVNAELQRRGIKLHLCDLKWPLSSQLQNTYLFEELSGELHDTAAVAMERLAELGSSLTS